MNLTLPLPDWVAATQKRLEHASAEELLLDELLSLTANSAPHLIEAFTVTLSSWSQGTDPDPEGRDRWWEFACLTLLWMSAAPRVEGLLSRRTGTSTPDAAELRAKVDALRAYRSELRDLMRLVIVARPEWDLAVPEELQVELWTYRISPLAYLRAMGNLFWSAVRHPLSNTTIDLSTGRVLYRT